MFANRYEKDLTDLKRSSEGLEGELRRLRDDFVTLQDRVAQWEIRMEEMQEVTLRAIRRHEARDRRKARGEGEGHTDGNGSPDPVTARILARRRRGRDGLPTEPQR